MGYRGRGKHPRVSGEYGPIVAMLPFVSETPPRERGIHYRTEISNTGLRNTPA